MEVAMAVQNPGYMPNETVAIVETGPAVSWGSVIAGAMTAAAISFVLLAVGAAFGLSMVSPWDSPETAEDAAVAVGIGAIIYLLVVHAVSSGFGGYVAGRLRRKLTGVRGDETYFRDTAHGVLVWALSAVVGAIVIAMVSAKVVSGGASLGAAGLVGAGAAMSNAGSAPGEGQAGAPNPVRELEGYYVDALFRPGGAPLPAEGTTGAATGAAGSTTSPATPPSPSVAGNTEERRREVGRILRVSVVNGEMSSGDKAYLSQLVSQETGMSEADASGRVDEVIRQFQAAREKAETAARDAAETARQGARGAAIWSAIALLVGAFAASLCATWGGRARDNY
jgi:hypothetical protein